MATAISNGFDPSSTMIATRLVLREDREDTFVMGEFYRFSTWCCVHQDVGMTSTYQPEPVSVADALSRFTELWSPRIIGRVNDYDVRVAKVQGEYVWHTHADTDEFFLVIDGLLSIDLRIGDEVREHTVELKPGEMYVVPAGVEHRPSSVVETSILLFEPSGTLTTGDYDGDIPDHIDSTTGHLVT
jgi:mannose-6-phosphate isomerase-like protein (cupin superfamily)